MDSIEERYNNFKSITGIALVVGLLLAFGTLLSRESRIIELSMLRLLKKRRKF